jgi:hypothetical protein
LRRTKVSTSSVARPARTGQAALRTGQTELAVIIDKRVLLEQRLAFAHHVDQRAATRQWH